MTRVQCVVQEVTIQGHCQTKPAFGWVTGCAQLLYVEVSPDGVKGAARRTETGILIQDGSRTHDVWVFGTSPDGSEPRGRSNCGAGLVFDVPTPVVLTVRVLSSYMTWHLALGMRAPLDLVAEGQLRVDDTSGEEMIAPLLRDGCTCGEAVFSVQRRIGKERPFCPRLTGCMDEDTRLFGDSADEIWDEVL